MFLIVSEKRLMIPCSLFLGFEVYRSQREIKKKKENPPPKKTGMKKVVYLVLRGTKKRVP